MVYQESVKENHDYINGLIMIALIIICPPIGIILEIFIIFLPSSNIAMLISLHLIRRISQTKGSIKIYN